MMTNKIIVKFCYDIIIINFACSIIGSHHTKSIGGAYNKIQHVMFLDLDQVQFYLYINASSCPVDLQQTWSPTSSHKL